MNTRSLILAVAATVVLAADEPAAAQKPAATQATKPATRAPAECPGTGSRIHQKAPHCTGAAPMRSYSQQDLESTGETDLGQALKKLDPIFH
jgi:hypothetical protein